MDEVAIWRDDVDALSFAVLADDRDRRHDHGAACFVHRRAFRILIGADPVGADCLAYHAEHAHAFQAAAWEKIDRQSIPPGRSLNLNSRDIRRALGKLEVGAGEGKGAQCQVLSKE
ncbi:hypothetical protein [Neorhizobium sp. JUb45]|uniref:hypothetical protein n=1 Tax=unclassified Neorhizobium TaxID=2629175 RepID=UPI0010509831|nr:hypothetical protein [Neorhizobium sp. JUb45]TCR00121.1 hypothetical protein EDF70_107199 [Neorhizobium sp. JUb45]